MQTATEATVATVDNIPLTAAESKRATADKEKKERQVKMNQLSEDATYISAVMREYTDLAAAAEECFEEKMRVPKFRDAVDRLMDWSSNKRHSDRLTVDGKIYKSVKAIFREKFGVSYDTVRRHAIKMSRLEKLMDIDDKIEAAETARIEVEAAGTDTQKPPVIVMPKPPQSKPITLPTQPTVEETLSENGHTPVIDLIRSTLQFIADCTGPLTAEERSVYYGNLIDELQNELDELDGE